MNLSRNALLSIILLACIATLSSCATGGRGSRSQIASDSVVALQSLYSQNQAAANLGRQADSVLVFPNVTRAGFVVGGQTGNGTLFRKGHFGNVSVARADSFFNTSAVSYGLQAGVQRMGYALFMMDPASAANLKRSGGWEIGGSPSLVVVDQGVATGLSTSTIRSGTYAFFFDQRGLMAGLGLQGTRITRITPGP
jgi:lipid-binding SYLF domain-containing protein